jgi:hypothetical protein
MPDTIDSGQEDAGFTDEKKDYADIAVAMK